MKKNTYGITYHEDYNKYDLGAGHPLIGNKPKKTIEFLKEKSLMKEIKLLTPEKAKEETEKPKKLRKKEEKKDEEK